MRTYLQQFDADEQRIDAEYPICLDTNKLASRAGSFSGIARYYAISADAEAARYQRLARDPEAWVTAWTSQPGGPNAAEIHALLRAVFYYIWSLRPMLEDIAGPLEEAVACAKFYADEAEKETEEERE